MFILDPREDRILDANAAACRVLGYTREELLATPVSDIHPHELPQMRSFVEAALLDGEKLDDRDGLSYQVRDLPPDGDRRCWPSTVEAMCTS